MMHDVAVGILILVGVERDRLLPHSGRQHRSRAIRRLPMDTRSQQPNETHQLVLDRFVAVCQADQRVVAAFLGGSYASGVADEYSDLDLGLIIADEAYDDFFAARESFLQQLGTLLVLQNSNRRDPDILFFILAGEVEGDLTLGRASHFQQMHVGPYRILLDKQGILAGVIFPPIARPHDEQVKALHGLISWFWHDLAHHFIASMARGQLWSAYGALEDMRRICVDLACLDANFGAEPESYEKVEQAVPAERLAALAASCCPLEREAMLRAARVIVQFYQALAPGLAQAHGIPYSAELARDMSERLERLCDTSVS
jgi:hypothetical protein